MTADRTGRAGFSPRGLGVRPTFSAASVSAPPNVRALSDPVQYLKGAGPSRAQHLARLRIVTVGDLLFHFPFRHELIPQSRAIGTLRLDETATVIGEIRLVRATGSRSAPILSAVVMDGTGECRATWFNSAYLADELKAGRIVRLTGKVDAYNDRAQFTNPRLTFLERSETAFDDDRDRFEPVYPASAAVTSKQIAGLVATALQTYGPSIDEFLPDRLRRSRELPPRRTAVERFHHPTSMDDVAKSRSRLAYDELLLSQLAVQVSRRRRKEGPTAPKIEVTEEIDRRIRQRFPFELTAGQNKAVAELRADLAQSSPMNRLLQADVGAGKTAVALYAALAAVANKLQVAIVAPTEVLAGQHFDKVNRYLSGSRVRVAYLAGSVATSRRAATLRELAAGKIDLVVGTHALFEQDVRFRSLGLVVIDEQHRFGVEQRAALRKKGAGAHTLVMTATPIPRTLAMTAFGELDVSTIEGVLPGRRPVVTRVVTSENRTKAWEFVRGRLSVGEQAYVVYPLVEESEAMPLKAATAEVERLSKSTLRGTSLGLLHGRMKPADKERVMERFRKGEIQALVSTTVIEVGVDVPNATLMIIEHAERYGLSQLHQLRGRVGRGDRKSWCLLMVGEGTTEAQRRGGYETSKRSNVQTSTPMGRLSERDRPSVAPQRVSAWLDDSPAGARPAPPGKEEATMSARLGIMCETNDGFRIAEEDLRIRGPGELLGTRQHGVPMFRVADLIRDGDLLEWAREDADEIIRADADLKRTEHRELRAELLNRYGSVISLTSVG